MSAARGFVLGVVGLALLEVVTANPTASSNTSTLIKFGSDGLSRWLDPNVALIPDRTGSSGTGSTTSGSGSSGTFVPTGPRIIS